VGWLETVRRRGARPRQRSCRRSRAPSRTRRAGMDQRRAAT